MKWSARFFVLLPWLSMLVGGCRLSAPSAEDYALVSGGGESGASTTGGVVEEGSSTGGMQSAGDAGEGSTTSTTDGSSTEGTETETGSQAVCGDGVVEGDEVCDDAGESVACNADCTAVVCGDDVVNATAGEQCDDAGESAACDADCTIVACGDGTTNPATGEECDDGGQSAQCDVDCTPAECGDGIFNANAGEECDDAGRTGACNLSCTLAECGDGYVNAAAGEACDDLGESATCNVDCTSAECGDGITNVTAGESCDDMGPSLSCDVDCTPADCGDGVANAAAGEDCDPAAESVGCDADCTSVVCGDGYINATAGEQCEGGDLVGGTCQSLGFDGGTLSCDLGCGYDVDDCANLPGVPVLMLWFSQVKRFDFSWAAVTGAGYYELEESAAPGEPFVQLGGNIVGTSVSHEMPLHFRWQASYRLRACNVAGCTESAPVAVASSLAEAVGYVKASTTDAGDRFGWDLALSGDGSTLAVGAFLEDSNAIGIDGDQTNDTAASSGAVYVFVTDGIGQWSQQAYIKAANAGGGDYFGQGVELSDDGNTLLVGAYREDSSATGVGGDPANNGAPESGAAYVFVRDTMGTWSQQAYLKASNAEAGDRFGQVVALSGDGNTAAVGAYWEDSNAVGVDGDQANELAPNSGAVYVFVRNGAGLWSQQAYVKSSNSEENDGFSLSSLDLSDDGNTLAVGARDEDGNATGVGGDQANNGAQSAGAAYVFVREGAGPWSQQAYIKASNTAGGDEFGSSVALSGDGNTLAVGAELEDSGATGIDGDQSSNSISNSGAVYVLVRDGTGSWQQQAYVKASNPGTSDQFGTIAALSESGDVLVVGAPAEDGGGVGIGGAEADNSATSAGAAYVFVRDGQWSQRAYVKASNSSASDRFGIYLALSADGQTLAIGADLEDGGATGIGGIQLDDSLADSGAVYLY